MHIAPRGFCSEELPNIGDRYASAMIAANEELKIIARLTLHLSTVGQSLFDVVDDVLGFNDLAVVFAHQPSVRSNQHHIHQVADGTIGLDLPAQLEARERLVHVAGTSGQKIPALLICALLTRVVEQLLGTVMLGIDADRNEGHLRAEVVAEPQRDVGELCRLHQTWARTRRVDEIDHQRLALKRREYDGVAILIDELGVGEDARGRRSVRRAAMAARGRDQAQAYCYRDRERSEI